VIRGPVPEPEPEPDYALPEEPIPAESWDHVLAKLADLRDTSDFDAIELVNLLYRFGGHPFVPEATWERVEEALLGFEFWYTQPTREGVVDDMWYSPEGGDGPAQVSSARVVDRNASSAHARSRRWEAAPSINSRSLVMRSTSTLSFIVATVATVAIVASVGGCLDSHDGRFADDPGTLRVEVATATRAPVRTVCYSVTVAYDAGESPSSPSVHGDPTRLFDTVAEAVQAGAICGQRPDPDSLTGLVASLTVPCEAGAGTVRVTIAGAFDEDGLALGEEDIRLDADLGGTLPFACVPSTETVVPFQLGVPVLDRLGFVEVVVHGAPPAGARAVCYAMRVMNGDGVVVWSKPEVCSDEYGDGEGGGIAYVGPCDAKAPANVVTLWSASAFGSDGAPLPDPSGPCADGHRVGEPTTWTGGCSEAVTCVQNADVTTSFDLPTLAP